MDISQLVRNVKMHRAYADVFKQHFTRLSGRAPSQMEIETLENAPLCLSGMRLELIELKLSRASTLSELASEFEFMRKEVESARVELQESYEAVAVRYGLHVPATRTATYLALEEELLRHVQQQGR